MPYRSSQPHKEWRPVVGYEGLYEVSDQGRVRSLERTTVRVTRRGQRIVQPIRARVMKPGPISSRCRHLQLALWKQGNREVVRVHRLVLEAFVGPCPPGMEACHYNDIGDDNRLSNLRWDTHAANRADAKRNGSHTWRRKARMAA